MHILWYFGICISGSRSSGLLFFARIFIFCRALGERARGQKVCDLLQVRLSARKILRTAKKNKRQPVPSKYLWDTFLPLICTYISICVCVI